jgi:hypothetical protein
VKWCYIALDVLENPEANPTSADETTDTKSKGKKK